MERNGIQHLYLDITRLESDKMKVETRTKQFHNSFPRLTPIREACPIDFKALVFEVL